MKPLKFDAPSNFTANGTSQVMLTYDKSRKFVELVNTHATQKAFLAFGDDTAVLNKGAVLMANGGTITMTEEFMNGCCNKMSIIADGAGTNIAINIGR